MSYTDEDIKKMPTYVLERYAAVLIGLETFDDFPVHAVHTYDTPTSFRVWQPTVDYLAARELQAEAIKKDKVGYVICLLKLMWWVDIEEDFRLTLEGAADLLKADPKKITKASVLILNKGGRGK
ncbi:hypothetical protein ACFVVQ_12220 [Paenibacillus chitinolyticus]|uniref:hypothetical protein n=1 Tax=Paenibacillus chitinolyticus TaxID=79263 RepID=UPI0036D76D92